MADSSEYKRSADFFASLSFRAQLKLIAAIFFTFATIGVITDMWQVGQERAWPWVLAMAVMSGLIALSWALAFIRSKWFFFFIPLTIVLQGVIAGVSVDGSSYYGEAASRTVSERLVVEGVACIIAIALGYIFFVVFIWKEGAGQLRLRTEVGLAQDIHNRLVPLIDMSTDRFEVYGESSASTEVGGDLLDAYRRDGSLTVTVADVSGHGVSAGALMGMVKSAMRMRLLSNDSLADLVGDLNRVVFQVKSEEMFVTLASMQFSTEGEVKVAIGGHPPLLHFSRSAGTITQITGENLPLGVVDDAAYQVQRIPYEPGDLFVMVTDGILEVVDDNDREFGYEETQSIVLTNADRPLREIADMILIAANAHGAQEDDQTLVIVRVLGKTAV